MLHSVARAALGASSFLLSGCILFAEDMEHPAPLVRSDADADADIDAAADAADADVQTGSLCGLDGRDECGPFMACDVELGCVECVRDDQCPAAARFCEVGACVGCRANVGVGDAADAATCPPDAPICFPHDHSCHAPCVGDTDCPAEAPRCDVSGTCVGCRADDECAPGVCSSVTRQCVECRVDEDCPVTAPRCRRAVGACVACTSNADCGIAAPICDPATLQCRRPQSDAGTIDGTIDDAGRD